MRCHPFRWLWGLIPVAMLSWIAVHLESRAIEHDLEQRSTAALTAAGHDWASVAFSGRDGLLVGYPSRRRDRDAAVALVEGVWGVRVVAARVAGPLADDAPLPPLEPVSAQPAVARLEPAQAPARLTFTAGVPIHPLSPLQPVPLGTGVDADDAMVSAVQLPAGFLAHDVPLTLPADQIVAHEVTAQEAPVAAAEAGESAHDVQADVQPSEARITGGEDVLAAAAPAQPDPASVPGTAAAPAATAGTDLSPATDVASAEVTDDTGNLDASGTTAPLLPERRLQSPERTASAAVAGSGPSSDTVTEVPVAAPPLPEQRPDGRRKRFETAALPQSHTNADPGCIDQARAAARAVEVYFALGHARLDGQGKALLTALARVVAACPGAALRIAGHADISGKAHRNLALSRRRAEVVASYLIDKGIDADRVVAIGYGDTRPAAPNDTSRNRARNRRIEVAVTQRMPPLPVRKQGAGHGLSDR